MDDQSPKGKAELAGSIARAANIYSVDEIIVYDDNTSHSNNEENKVKITFLLVLFIVYKWLEFFNIWSIPNLFEKKNFFPSHSDLKFIRKPTTPFNALHHLRLIDYYSYMVSF